MVVSVMYCNFLYRVESIGGYGEWYGVAKMSDGAVVGGDN